MLDPEELGDLLWFWWPSIGPRFFTQLVALALIVVGLAVWQPLGRPIVGGALVVAGVLVLVVAEVRWLLGRGPDRGSSR